MPKVSQQVRTESAAKLLSMLSPGDTVYTSVRHTSSSGLSRSLDVYVIRDNQPIWLTRHVANACGLSWDTKREALKVSGCGMDMGFHVVYILGATLWPNGTPEPHGTRNEEPDSEGGYALKHRWM